MSSSSAAHSHGITLPNGCTIVHGEGANIKHPFRDVPVEMHELDPGGNPKRSFAGQFGFIEFTTEFRLPRHVHIAPASASAGAERKFVSERIVVLNGVALVELNGAIYVIPPKSLVTIAPGVPHTWTACPAGVTLPLWGRQTEPDSRSEPATETEIRTEEVTSTGTFLMLYEYEEPTAFFPTAQTKTLSQIDEYQRCDDLESIQIPKLSDVDVKEWCSFVWGKQLLSPSQAGVRA
ncbi:hypothetical protein G647_07935 [Cladophialophora carrionii CBS 160.54]|uniref:Uncharacterized protein n=1 Tax=Cladophialophora carrionii CBS 160.54 TaxID=1279043 RepID=V9D5L6_9EURO|nr:uncharacterized protein G647_07935 [Cladophialophora carrionii CBS 160.54]ETI21588.1 hypothetical protein G647_07935 [Cladophialophora carrionii CBS 160.54]